MSTERLQVVRRPVTGTVRPPGSKSLTNRALVAAALADGESLLHGCLDSDDARYMSRAWRKLGANIAMANDGKPGAMPAPQACRSRRSAARRQDGATVGLPDRANTASASDVLLRVRGCAGRLKPGPVELRVGNAGTAMRFLTAVAALGHGDYRLDGAARMRQRPIEDLLAALRRLGVDARSESGSGCPPVLVRADGLPGGPVAVSGRISSQYLSGLLLAAPYAQSPVAITVEGDLVSKPYAAMTCRLMADFGVPVTNDDFRRFVVEPSCYQAREYCVEPDATAATYFWAAAALTGGRVTVAGLTAASAQGDVGFLRVLEQMGCRVSQDAAGLTVEGPPGQTRLRGLCVDLNAMPDTALTLAALALFADGETVIENVANLRVKETDRLAALAAELRKFGATVAELPDGLRIVPPAVVRPAQVETYDDHRLAMSFALAALRVEGVEILGAQCVAKTFPDYFAVLRRLAGQE
jgi:3-phosphoshikimate 1-carboxyvinyltransferase